LEKVEHAHRHSCLAYCDTNWAHSKDFLSDILTFLTCTPWLWAKHAPKICPHLSFFSYDLKIELAQYYLTGQAQECVCLWCFPIWIYIGSTTIIHSHASFVQGGHCFGNNSHALLTPLQVINLSPLFYFLVMLVLTLYSSRCQPIVLGYKSLFWI
jgi:hypothetical protein